nr:exodeoxyribonuclease III [Coriobacterium glomerans]
MQRAGSQPERADERIYRFASWNVNGLRALMKKEPDFSEIAASLNADILAIQETKLQEGQIDLDLAGYHQTWSYAARKGYSGTAVFSREQPIRTLRADAMLDVVEGGELLEPAIREGRVCALEFERFWFADVYTPNSQDGLARLPVRLAWDEAYRAFLKQLERMGDKPVVTCGDFNVAHNEIDLRNPKSNRGNAGFSDEERASFSRLLEAGFTDTFRYLYPDVRDAYSWWSYRFHARRTNAGWRIDYFLVSDSVRDRIVEATIRQDVFGSDHCPVELVIAL